MARHRRLLRRDDVDLVVAAVGVDRATQWGLVSGEGLPGWADAACHQWGLFGAGWDVGGGLSALVVVTPQESLPADHPVAHLPHVPGSAVVAAAWWSGGEATWWRRALGVGGPDAGGRAAAVMTSLAGVLRPWVPAVEAGGVAVPGTDLRVVACGVLEAWGFERVDPGATTSDSSGAGFAVPVHRMVLDLRRTVSAGDGSWQRVMGWWRQRGLQPGSVASRARSR